MHKGVSKKELTKKRKPIGLDNEGNISGLVNGIFVDYKAGSQFASINSDLRLYGIESGISLEKLIEKVKAFHAESEKRRKAGTLDTWKYHQYLEQTLVSYRNRLGVNGMGKTDKEIHEFYSKAYPFQHLTADSTITWNYPMSEIRAATGANPKRNSSDVSYMENCQTCVVAYELRRRGYNVEAMGLDKNNKDQDKLSHEEEIGTVWKDINGNSAQALFRAKASEKSEMIQERLNFLEETVKKGERYLYTLKERMGNAHVMIAERNQENQLVIVDPQTGKSYVGEKEVLKVIKRQVFPKINPITEGEDQLRQKAAPRLYRIDDKVLESSIWINTIITKS